ncbi:hypothetical protein MPH_03939 [Macrophomina phaseolina MS6]|uniref:Uncharacterized protein n=1 Tax=Macrophomina phaseolina (strain MS6) TaxID=1126212 RepID=K2RVG3_MACPH|nr:hypothetical protein MPH_03939 [Macrophomina phaseolina MS6]
MRILAHAQYVAKSCTIDLTRPVGRERTKSMKKGCENWKQGRESVSRNNTNARIASADTIRAKWPDDGEKRCDNASNTGATRTWQDGWNDSALETKKNAMRTSWAIGKGQRNTNESRTNIHKQ